MYSCPPQFFGWSAVFFVWYVIYVGSFLRAFAFTSHQWYAFIAEFVAFNLIWLVAVWSLVTTTLTRPAAIPKIFHIPSDVLSVPKDTNSDDSTTTDSSTSVATRIQVWADKNNVPYLAWVGDAKSELRVCERCKVVKPPRSHHCSRCKTCVLRMDHHCPFIGACVHQHNHKYFVQFIFWSCFLGLFAAATMLPHLMIALDSASVYPVDFALSSFGAIAAVIFFVGLGVFLVILCRGLLRNRTTLEQNVIDYKPDDRDVEDYDLGSVYANFKTVFGRPSLAWVLPIESKYRVACSSQNVV